MNYDNTNLTKLHHFALLALLLLFKTHTVDCICIFFHYLPD